MGSAAGTAMPAGLGPSPAMQDGEFVLERISQIAHAAGVPLGDEHCHPNLYILVTSQPEDLLKGMEKRNRGYTFGYNPSLRAETPASVVDEFIKTPHAVRVWYNSNEKDAWGQALSYCPASEIEMITCVPGDPKCYPPHFEAQVGCLQCGRGTAGVEPISHSTICGGFRGSSSLWIRSDFTR